MSEKVLAESLQTELLRLTTVFSSGDVVIGDWSILDGPSERAPYVLIDVSEGATLSNIQADATMTWEIPIVLIVRFTDWDSSMIEFRDTRNSILQHLRNVNGFLDGSARLSWGLDSIRSDGGISSIYDQYLEEASEALPVFLSQRLILSVGELV